MADSTEFGAFVPTTDDFDVEALKEMNIDPQLADLTIRLYQSYNDLALITNIKESAYYLPVEFVTGQQWFSPEGQDRAENDSIVRQGYRRVVNFGALPNGLPSKTIAHKIAGIGTSTSFTRIYGTATDPATQTYIPLPYVSSAGGNEIELSVDATNVIITTTFDWSAYTTTYIILEYLKN